MLATGEFGHVFFLVLLQELIRSAGALPCVERGKTKYSDAVCGVELRFYDL